MKLEYLGIDKLFLRQEIGKGTLPDGRECSLSMINQGLLFEIKTKKDKVQITGNWKTYSLSFTELSEEIMKEALKMEGEQQ
jgi:hypothetical protein